MRVSLPSEYAARKAFPILTVFCAYFPDAMEALVALCVQGNVQHKVDDSAVNPFKLPEDTITWDRSKSNDHGNTAMRHLWDHNRAKRGTGSVVDNDKVLHIVKAMWRTAAEAQLTIERLREEARPPVVDVPAGTPLRDARAGMELVADLQRSRVTDGPDYNPHG